MTGDDERLLARTLELAERGRRTASPNPVVGCVIARDGRVLGEGWHVRPGERHAETNALLACARRGASARRRTSRSSRARTTGVSRPAPTR